MAEETQRYTLNHGCHKGTIQSRDTTTPEHFDTQAQAVARLDKHRRWYARLGYKIWFAELTAPDGTKTTLESNPVW